jgi:hypothetical protein
MSCKCNYTVLNGSPCVSCLNLENTDVKASVIQKRIWNQVRAPASTYLMNISAFTSAGNRLASGSNVNWNQMSDRVFAARQPSLIPTHGNSLHSTLTSGRPGASTPGGKGVDVKHDSYARYLNRKKAGNLKTQTLNPTLNPVPLYGNKTHMINLAAASVNCCS